MSEPDKNDPFAAFDGSDRTVIKPSAGRGPRAPAPGPVPAPAPGWAPAPPAAPVDELPPYASLNPLVQAAAPLLSAAPRLRAMVRHPNPQALRASLGDAMQRFEAACRAQGLPEAQMVAARYVLCTLLDESASSTPWGGSGAWTSQSLLVQFHNESFGGEKVFQLLARLKQQPVEQRPLLELVWVALAMGLEGRFRVMDGGRQQLEKVREDLATLLRQPADPTLSPHWQGVTRPPARLRDGIPMWVVAAGAAALLLMVFIGLRLSLNAQTDDTFAAIQGLDAKAAVAPPAPPPAVPPPPPPPRLAQLLKSDIEAGAVQVKDGAQSSMVTILGDSLFDPGKAEVAARARPLFGRIAEALNQLPGHVLVTGHTDNQPIRSLRFPSNWHLSKDRALAVRDLLATTVKPDRITAEGRADTEPVADNNSVEGRAKNRRVEVTLTVAAQP